MADPEVPRGVNDLLVEEDMEDDEAVPSLPSGPPYLASSSDEDEADGDPSRAITAGVPTGRPSGGLMSVCSGTVAPSGGGQPRVVESLPPPRATRLGTGAGAGVGLSQGGPAGRNGGEASPVDGGNSPSVSAGQGGPGRRHGGEASPVGGGNSPTVLVGQDGPGSRPAGVPAVVVADVPAGSVSTRWSPLASLRAKEVPPAAEVLPAVPRVSGAQDAPSPMAVDGGSYYVRVPALLLPPRPRLAVPLQVPVGLPPVPAVLPGPARVAPSGGGVAVTVGAPPLSVSDLVARVRGMSVK